jgi:Na+/H+ antiporter NhaD/arsenite permease-like protein
LSFLPTAFALLTAAAGWFYLFYSRAAHDLSGIENEADNRHRVLLRRAGGVCMILLGIGFFMGFNTFDPKERPIAFFAIWLAVFLLLGTTIVLALIDIHLTMRLRRRRQQQASRRTPTDDH